MRIALSVWHLPQPMEPLAQALSPLAPIAPVRNSRRTAGTPLARNGAGLSGTGHAECNALEIISSPDRARIVSSAQSALGLIRGRWKIAILATMLDGPVRLGQLRRLIPQASKKVLVQQLHELENDGIVERTDLSRKVKHVEYAISVPLRSAVMNLLKTLSDWGIRLAPAIARHGRTQTDATLVVLMPVKSEITVQAAPSALFGPKRLRRIQP